MLVPLHGLSFVPILSTGMYHFLRKQLLVFLIGFVIAFVIYLLFQLTREEMLTGLGIGAAAGLVLVIALYFLERQFPEQIPGSNEPPQ